MPLSRAQQSEFETTGILTLRGAVPKADTAAMAERLWAELARRDGILRSDRATWTVEKPAQFQALERSGAFAAMGSQAVRAALDAVLPGWGEPQTWGQVLATFPGKAAHWDVPQQSWHLDAPPAPDAPIASVRAFVMQERVEPGGAGTVCLSGSHRLVQNYARAAGAELKSATLRAGLAQTYPWLAELWSPPNGVDRVARFMDEGVMLDGAQLRVVELTGEAGDAFILHPGVFHTFAPNCRDTPRLMLVQALYPRREA